MEKKHVGCLYVDHLCLSEVEPRRQIEPLWAHHVLLPVKLLLHPLELLRGEDGPDEGGVVEVAVKEGEEEKKEEEEEEEGEEEKEEEEEEEEGEGEKEEE